MQYTEREHAKQVLKSSFSFIYQYFYRYSGTDTQGSQEFIYLDGLIGFRYQMTVCAETKNHLLSFAEWLLTKIGDHHFLSQHPALSNNPT